MSQWTHVAGCIRYDWLQIPGVPEMDFDKVLGTPGDLDHMEDIRNIPAGSEGSIQYEVITNSNHSAIAAYNVVIWGDLRGFADGNVPDIKEWFGRAINATFKIWIAGKQQEMRPMIRSAVLKIDVEYGPTYILRNTDTNKVVVTRID